MTIIYAATEDQHLIATILPKLSQNNVNTVRLHVAFDSAWDAYKARTAVFTTSKSSRPYPVSLSSDGDCLIPPEVLAEECKLYITVKGENSTTGTSKSSTRLTVKVLGGSPALIISDPSPSVYQQLLTANAVLLSRLSQLEAGGTVDGSEVIGIRTGADGTVYPTAGDAVRGQFDAVRQLAYNTFYTRATYLRHIRCDVNTVTKIVSLTRTNTKEPVIFSDKRWVFVNSDSAFNYGAAETSSAIGFTAAFVYNTAEQAIVMREMKASNPHDIFDKEDIVLFCLYLDDNRNLVAVPLAEINNFYIDGEIYPEEAISPEWAIGSMHLRVNVDVANNKLTCTKGGNVFFPSTTVLNNAYVVTEHETECEFLRSRTVAVVLDATQTLQIRYVYSGNSTFKKGDVVLGVFHISNTGALNEAFCHKQMEQVFSFNGVSVFADPIAEIKKAKKLNKTTCKIFKRVCCCGDSFTSGHIVDADGVAHPINEHFAWPHYMATATGNEWINCGQSGANVLTWQTAERGLKKAQTSGKVQAYVIGLMLNDVASGTERYVELGTPEDIGTNAQTYYGGMSTIIRELNAISPNAKIFVLICPRTGDAFTSYNQAVRDIVEAYKDTYPVHCLDLLANIDMYKEESLTGDSIGGHYTAIGYEQFAEIMSVILSNYINEHIADFQDVAFIEYDA